jgi:hypothetical protein
VNVVVRKRIVTGGINLGEDLIDGVLTRHSSTSTPDEDFGSEGVVIIR